MKVNLFKDEDLLVLKVSDAPFDITDVLFNFLANIQEVDTGTLEAIGENTIRFATEEIEEEEFKDWKLSIINSVREMMSQDEEELKANYLISHQQLEAINREFTEAQSQLLQARLELIVSQKYNQHLLAVAGLAIIVALTAVAVAIVGLVI